MHDENIQIPMANFAKDILCSYKEETTDITIEKECSSEKTVYKTKSGRESKKPRKLNL